MVEKWREHVKERLMERYNIKMPDEDYELLCDLTNYVTYPTKVSPNKYIGYIRYKNKHLKVVYTKKGKVITALPIRRKTKKS